jgi:hypothetical protein
MAALGIVDRWVAALRELVRDTVADRLRYQGISDYVVVSSGNGTCDATPADPEAGLPNHRGIPIWTGIPGASVQVSPGAHVGVLFLDANPAKPRVVLFDSTQALTLSFAASGQIQVGPSAAAVALSGGATPIVPTPWATALDVALAALATALTTGTLGSMAAGGSALTTALGLLPSNATSKTTAT